MDVEKPTSEGSPPAAVVVDFDPSQFVADQRAGIVSTLHEMMNVIVRWDRKQNNFLPVLHAIHALLINGEPSLCVPAWLRKYFVATPRTEQIPGGASRTDGCSSGAVSAGGPWEEEVDMFDTFVSETHVSEVLGEMGLEFLYVIGSQENGERKGATLSDCGFSVLPAFFPCLQWKRQGRIVSLYPYYPESLTSRTHRSFAELLVLSSLGVRKEQRGLSAAAKRRSRRKARQSIERDGGQQQGNEGMEEAKEEEASVCGLEEQAGAIGGEPLFVEDPLYLRRNTIAFYRRQVEAIRSVLGEDLTFVVGPPRCG